MARITTDRRQAIRIIGLAALAAPLAACVGSTYSAPAIGPARRYGLASDVLFDFGSANLRPGGFAALQDILRQILATYPYPSIRVIGHTDSIGGVAANEALSLARADAVRRWLMDAGIPPQAIITQGLGEQQPVAPNTLPNGADNPDGRAQNRRVELIATPA